MQLAKIVYEITKSFPKEETFNMIAQLRRAVISIPSNIAEWNERSSEKDFKRFIEIAKGSAVEVLIQTELARNLEYIVDKKKYEDICGLSNEIVKMLSWLLR